MCKRHTSNWGEMTKRWRQMNQTKQNKTKEEEKYQDLQKTTGNEIEIKKNRKKKEQKKRTETMNI